MRAVVFFSLISLFVLSCGREVSEIGSEIKGRSKTVPSILNGGSGKSGDIKRPETRVASMVLATTVRDRMGVRGDSDSCLQLVVGSSTSASLYVSANGCQERELVSANVLKKFKVKGNIFRGAKLVLDGKEIGEFGPGMVDGRAVYVVRELCDGTRFACKPVLDNGSLRDIEIL